MDTGKISNTTTGIRKLRRLVKGIRVAMMTTTTEDGSIHSRPMATCEVEDDGAFWFFTSCETPKVHEIDIDHRVNLTYADPEGDRYITISGAAELVRDREKMRSLFRPLYRIWFPRGLEDPNIALLRVDVKRAEYWDPTAGILSALASRLRAALTGTAVFPAKHGVIDIGRGAEQLPSSS